MNRQTKKSQFLIGETWSNARKKQYWLHLIFENPKLKQIYIIIILGQNAPRKKPQHNFPYKMPLRQNPPATDEKN